MNGRESDLLLEQLNGLRAEIGSDFCSLGLLEGAERTLKWKLASGNENERFLKMTDRAGRGLTGSVVKVGRAMSLNVAELIMSRQLYEYPILLAENLRSAYAVPVFDGHLVIGVLLAGDRRKRIYRPEERKCVSLAGERISRLLIANSAESPSS
ncbi:GAF domain-containing protein [Cohnella silvisoli]|uniref:GAF domain-containing protein n=1 Tax=Cohnella silvisoli TaxID=2873699 RepID=A0ABV1KLZ3_9BACL|nr:GAF domain-containing protein [Cohnella silvisoli]MCD9020679.1 GAF domain-containing protein [Cohnella silvisoli]